MTYGTGAEARAGSKIKVRYTGRLKGSDGKMFDQNVTKGMKIVLGMGKVIEGWDTGLLGIRQGGVREILVPSSMAYGPKGVSGQIPPNSTLWFVVEVVSVR